ncbi:hypothetical protein HDU86_007175 [Geranomyces michiganensis]|nr:hypothetical protein HDU86_007175 [Geranomyces michiganensis]
MFPTLAARFTTAAGYTARPMMARAYIARPAMSFRSAPPFGRAFPSNTGNSAFSSRFSSSRNYTTGFAQRAYQQGGQQTFNAFAGFKVLPGAVADERFANRDGKRNTAAKGAFTRRHSDCKTSAASSRPARLNSTRRAQKTKSVDAAAEDAKLKVCEPLAIAAAPAIVKKAYRDLSKLPDAASGKQCRESVTLSIFLYGPPAWEMDSVHPDTTTRISAALIAELRTLAAIHRDHLTSVATTLETLLAHGFKDVSVVEEDNGVYELVVRFPRGYGRDRVVDCLIVMGIDPCSESFRLECRIEDEVKDHASGFSLADAAKGNAGSGNDFADGFPWRRAHSPSDSLSRQSLACAVVAAPTSAHDFLLLVNDLQGAGSHKMSFSV